MSSQLSEKSLCTTLSKRKETDFRPVVQELLHRRDDTFDLRFGSFLQLKSVILRRKLDCFEKRIGQVVKILQSSGFGDESPRLKFSVITTALSNADRSYLIDEAVGQLRDNLTVQVLLVECVSTSAFELLIEVARSLILRFEQFKNLLDEAEDYPLQTIDTILSETATFLTTVMVLKRSESIDSVAMGQFIRLLSGSRHCNGRLHVVAMTNVMNALPVPDDFRARSLLRLSTTSVEDAGEIFDDLMAFIYSSDVIPVVFPKGIIEGIHQSFRVYNRCVTSMLNKIILILGLHFQKKPSILCMYNHHADKIFELLKKRGEPDADVALRDLLRLLGEGDVKSTNIKLDWATQRQKMLVFEERTKVDRILFATLRRLRSEFRPEERRPPIPADLLWSAVSDGRQSHLGLCTRVMYDLIDNVKKGIRRSSVQQLSAILAEFIGQFKAINLTLLGAYDEERLQLVGEGEREASVRQFVVHLLEDTAKVKKLLDGFSHDFPGLDTKSIAALQGATNQKELSFNIAKRGAAPDMQGMTPFDLLSRVVSEDFIPWLEHGLAGSIRRLSPVAAEDGVFHISPPNQLLLQQLADDNLQTAFTSAVEKPDSYFAKFKGANLDCPIIFGKFSEDGGQVVANDWIEELVQMGDKWATPATAAAPAKKPRLGGEQWTLGVADKHYSALARCRFAATLNDMERSGLLRCRKSGKQGLVVVSKEMHNLASKKGPAGRM